MAVGNKNSGVGIGRQRCLVRQQNTELFNAKSLAEKNSIQLLRFADPVDHDLVCVLWERLCMVVDRVTSCYNLPGLSGTHPAN